MTVREFIVGMSFIGIFANSTLDKKEIIYKTYCSIKSENFPGNFSKKFSENSENLPGIIQVFERLKPPKSAIRCIYFGNFF